MIIRCPKCNGSGVEYYYVEDLPEETLKHIITENDEGKFAILDCPKCNGRGWLNVDKETKHLVT